MTSKSKIDKSFKIGVVTLALVLIALVSIIIGKNKDLDFSAILIGLPLFLAGLLSIVGTIQFFRGLKETKSFRYFFSMVINIGMVILLVCLILANVIDAISIFK